MFQLFPNSSPIRQDWLPVGDGHALHWEISGNIKGIPVVWLHGGPGSSASPLHRCFFDPERFFIIQYDQRGCGKSRAENPLLHNQTQDLVADLELLRSFLGLSAWSVVGGSWGGALALAYAQKHSAVIDHLLLRSPFLCSPLEIDRFMNHPPAACMPQWLALARHLPKDSTESLLSYGHRIFCQEQEESTQSALALNWAQYESVMNAYPEPAPDFLLKTGESLISRYQVQCHYLAHHCFVARDDLLAAGPLNQLDLTLIHGQQDALCPLSNSLAIQAVAPASTLIELAGCGHELATVPMQQALLGAVAKW